MCEGVGVGRFPVVRAAPGPVGMVYSTEVAKPCCPSLVDGVQDIRPLYGGVLCRGQSGLACAADARVYHLPEQQLPIWFDVQGVGAFHKPSREGQKKSLATVVRSDGYLFGEVSI